MKIGITAGSYTQYGMSEGSRKAREHGYDCYDFGRFVNTETEFFKLPEAEFKPKFFKKLKKLCWKDS